MDSGDRFKDRMEELRAGYDPSEGISRHWGADTEAFYEERGLGGRTGFGERPGLLVIDMARAFNDPSFKVGADQTPAVEAIAKLLPAARTAGIPIYFVVTAYHRDGRDVGMFGRKIPALPSSSSTSRRRWRSTSASRSRRASTSSSRSSPRRSSGRTSPRCSRTTGSTRSS